MKCSRCSLEFKDETDYWKYVDDEGHIFNSQLSVFHIRDSKFSIRRYNICPDCAKLVEDFVNAKER